MIGSGNISSYGTHAHEHTVTRCIHESHGSRPQSSGGGPGSVAAKAAEGRRASFSLQELLSGGWEGFVSKSFSLLEKGWGNGGLAAEKDGGERTAGIVAAYGTESMTGERTGQAAGTSVSAEILASASVREQVREQDFEKAAGSGGKSVPKAENQSGGMADGTEDTAESRTWKKQTGVRKFFRQFEKTAAEVRQSWKKQEESEEEDGGSEERNSMDVALGDSSYLLDSYNRSGEYSTLAENRSQEGKFRAMG